MTRFASLKRAALVLTLLCLALLRPVGAQNTYTITDLGVLPGHTESHAHRINNLGQVVGKLGNFSGARAFLWSADTGMRDLGVFAGHYFSEARSINDFGQVVGVSQGSDNNGLPISRAFLWSQADGLTNLGLLPGGTFSSAYGINNLGQVVGNASTSNADRAFLWTAGSGLTDLGDPFGGGRIEAFDINDLAQVAGRAGNRAMVWSAAGGMTQAGVISEGHTYNFARAINDLGAKLVKGGFAYPSTASTSESYLWNHTGAFSGLLGTLSSSTQSDPYDINNAGQVVGVAYTNQPEAFLWTAERGMINLDTLLPAGSGWDTATARAINDLGQIVGDGSHNGQTHAFLLTPNNLFAKNITVGADNKTRVLLTSPAGKLDWRILDTNGNWENEAVAHGPFGGWTIKNIAAGADNKTRVLWNNTNGTMAWWTLSANGVQENVRLHGPYYDR